MTKAAELFSRGLAAYQARDFDGARDLFSAALSLSPQNANYLYYRGSVSQELGDTDTAIADFSKALALVPSCAPIRYSRADLYFSSGKTAEAVADFDEIIQHAGTDARYWVSLAYLGRGIAALDCGNIDGAISDLTAAEDAAKEEGDAGLIARIGSELERNGF
ncbi:MAG: tetratricopeptide repeat protein [Methanocorpusculum sp.]|nr:tetratricopeptide repeat protein [Methanocorpusculum sp.]